MSECRLNLLFRLRILVLPVIRLEIRPSLNINASGRVYDVQVNIRVKFKMEYASWRLFPHLHQIVQKIIPILYRHIYEGTVQDAQTEGLYVTHSNPCGVCSSLQDLSVYMEQGPQLRKSASDCGIAGILGEAAGCWNKVLSKLGIYRQLRNNVVL